MGTPEHEELGQGVLQLHDAVAAFDVRGHGEMRAVLQNLVHQSREHALRSDFDEDRRTGFGHGFNFRLELHRRRQMLREQVADFVRLGGILRSQRVRVHRFRRAWRRGFR